MTVNHLMIYPTAWLKADPSLEADGPERDEPCGICGRYPATGCMGHTEAADTAHLKGAPSAD